MESIELLRGTHKIYKLFTRKLYEMIDEQEKKLMIGNSLVLKRLREHEHITQSQLADILEIRPQSLTTSLARIEEKGLIVRTRSDKDKREQFVDITQAGIEQSIILEQHRSDTADVIFSCLNEEERETLLSIVNKIVEANK